MLAKKSFAIIATVILCLFIGRFILSQMPKFTPPKEAITLENAHKIELIKELKYDQTEAITFSNDGSLLFVAKGTQFMIIDMNTGKQIHKIGLGDTNNPFYPGQADIVAEFSPNDQYLAVGRSDPEGLNWGTVQIWSVSTWQKLNISSRQGGVMGLDFSFDSQFLSYETFKSFGNGATWISDVHIINLSAKGEIREFLDIITAVFSPTDTRLVYSTEDGVYIWDYEADTLVKLQNFPSQRYLTFTPNGKMLIGIDANTDHLAIWDFEQNKQVNLFSQEREREVITMAISPDSQVLAFSSVDSNWQNPQITVFDLVTRTTKYNLSGHTNMVTGLVFSPDSKLLISTGYEIKIWNMQSGSEIKTLQVTNDIWATTIDTKSKLIVVISEYGHKIQLWGIPND